MMIHYSCNCGIDIIIFHYLSDCLLGQEFFLLFVIVLIAVDVIYFIFIYCLCVATNHFLREAMEKRLKVVKDIDTKVAFIGFALGLSVMIV